MGIRVFLYGEDGFSNLTLANSLTILGLDVIGEIDNDVVAANLITHHLPDVVVLQISYGHLKAINLAKAIRKNFPFMGIVLAAKSEDLRLLGLEKKKLPVGVLVTAIAKHGDLDHLKIDIERAPKCVKCKSDFHRCAPFTDSQIEVLRLVVAGNANSEIARMRYVSEKSVEQMLARISIELGIVFDHKHNTRVRLTNSYFELVNGRK